MDCARSCKPPQPTLRITRDTNRKRLFFGLIILIRTLEA